MNQGQFFHLPKLGPASPETELAGYCLFVVGNYYTSCVEICQPVRVRVFQSVVKATMLALQSESTIIPMQSDLKRLSERWLYLVATSICKLYIRP